MTEVPGSRRWPFYVVTALSLSIGWGIRGNFGHEYGAMIPGALAAVAAAVLSGREAWARGVAVFGFFGALGVVFRRQHIVHARDLLDGVGRFGGDYARAGWQQF